jgi:hypothetical protein
MTEPARKALRVGKNQNAAPVLSLLFLLMMHAFDSGIPCWKSTAGTCAGTFTVWAMAFLMR